MPGDPEMPAFEEPVLRGKLKLPKVGTILIIIVGGLVLLVAAVPQARNYFLGYEIVLSKPALKGDWVSGSFRFQHIIFGQSWNGTGGACLVADIANLVPAGDEHKAELNGGSCTKQSDCLVAGEESQRWWGYCVPEANKNEGRCWYKPVEGNDATLLCRRSIDYDPLQKWDLGHNYVVPDKVLVSKILVVGKGFDVHDFYREHTGGKSADWRLVGVLNNKGGQHVRYGEPAKLE